MVNRMSNSTNSINCFSLSIVLVSPYVIFEIAYDSATEGSSAIYNLEKQCILLKNCIYSYAVIFHQVSVQRLMLLDL